MDLPTEARYRLHVGVRDIECTLRSDVLLTCVSPEGPEFENSNENALCSAVRTTNTSLYDAKHMEDCKPLNSLRRPGNVVPVGLSHNHGYVYSAVNTTVSYFDRLIGGGQC